MPNYLVLIDSHRNELLTTVLGQLTLQSLSKVFGPKSAFRDKPLGSHSFVPWRNKLFIQSEKYSGL